MSEKAAPRIWYAEKSETGTFDLHEWPGYCEENEAEVFNSLPDEVDLVEKSYADELERELECEKSAHNFTRDMYDGQAEELSQAQAKIKELTENKNKIYDTYVEENKKWTIERERRRNLESQLAESQRKLGILKSAVEFYGNPEHWHKAWGSCSDSSFTMNQDCGDFSRDDCAVGGLRARQALKETL